MKQKQVERENFVVLDELDFQSWSTVTEKIRNDSLKATVIDCKYESETVQLCYTVNEFPEKEFSETVDASVYPNGKSDFEKMLERYGYEQYRENSLVGETVDIEVERVDDNLQIKLITNFESNNSNNEQSVMFAQALVGFLLGIFPLVNLALFFDLYTSEDIDKLVDSEKYTLVAISSTLGFIIVYIFPLLFLTLCVI